MEISEMITELQRKGYKITKITSGMRDDSNECMKLEEKGESMDCFTCHCSLCIMQ